MLEVYALFIVGLIFQLNVIFKAKGVRRNERL